MEARHGVVGRVWIADRGMASAANVAWLRATGRRYLSGAPQSALKKFNAALATQLGWRTIRAGVEVKLARCAETGETVIRCRAADRQRKERAMHEKFSARIEAALGRLAGRTERSTKPIDPTQVNRQSGRILQQNQRAAARFEARLIELDCPAGCRLEVHLNAAFDDWAALSEGAYLLRSNLTDWTDAQRWKAYIQLTQVEAAFRLQTDQLHVRPIWQQRAARVQAHILVCFLACVLWKTLALWQQRAGLGNSPRTVLEELVRIQSPDVVLPTPTHGEIRLRGVTQPDAAQAVCSNASASSCLNACAAANSICPPSISALNRPHQNQNCSADFLAKALIYQFGYADSAQVGLDGFHAYPVSTRVNTPKNDDVTLIEETAVAYVRQRTEEVSMIPYCTP